MAFFKRVQKKVNDLWYPQSVTWGKAVTTREVADELSDVYKRQLHDCLVCGI